MTSNIISDTIDAEYPVAGVDNDTQGFRDNFSIIKDGLGVAQAEITELQDSSAKLDADNNFDGSEIAGAVFINNTQAMLTPTNPVELSYANGSYFEVTVVKGSGDRNEVALELVDWPDSGYAVIRTSVRTEGSEETDVPLRFFSSAAGTTTFYDNNWPVSLEVSDNRRVYEFWTFNGGNTVYMKYLGEFTAAA